MQVDARRQRERQLHFMTREASRVANCNWRQKL